MKFHELSVNCNCYEHINNVCISARGNCQKARILLFLNLHHVFLEQLQSMDIIVRHSTRKLENWVYTVFVLHGAVNRHKTNNWQLYMQIGHYLMMMS